MENLKTTIRQTAVMYSLDIECTADAMSRSIVKRVFGSLNKIIFGDVSVYGNIYYLCSVQLVDTWKQKRNLK